MTPVRTEEFIGVTILGVGGDEIINTFAPFMLAKQSYRTFRKAVFTHPTAAPGRGSGAAAAEW